MHTQSSKWRRWSILLTTLVTAAFLLQGCGGGDDGSAGPAGATGATGPAGAAGPAGADKTTGTVDAVNLTFNDLTTRALAVQITSADTSSDKPVVKFKVTMKDNGEGVRGLRSFTLQLAQLKPAADGSASYWQNYISDGLPLTAIPALVARGATTPAAPTNPTTDAVTFYNTDGTVKAQGYSVVDEGDGNYTVTFGANIKANAKVPYDATLTHRIGVGVRSVVVPGVVGKTAGAYAGPINPSTGAVFAQFTNTNGAVDVYDFTPSTTSPGTKLASSARDNVTIAACNQCHYKIEHGSNNTSGHFGSRPDTKFCVMCHTPQLFSGKGDFTYFVHQIHMGEELPVAATGLPAGFETTVADIRYPQDQRNCTTCHKGTVTDSWKKPTLKACGACHNNVNFATGAGHIGGAKADDKQCAICHGATEIALYHVPVPAVISTTSGMTSRYADNSSLPTGAYTIAYAVNSVTVNSDRTVSVKFQIMKDGAAVNFGTYNAATNPNIIPNTVGGPSLRIGYNVPQDSNNSPADLNTYITMPGLGIAAPTVTTTATPPGVYTAPSTASSLWVNPTGVVSNGITWTMTGPDAANAYTVKASLPMPATTTMVYALLYGSFTQTNLTGNYAFAASSIADYTAYVNATGSNAGKTSYALKQQGLIIAPTLVLKASTSSGFTARRTVVSKAKCDSCHDQLGIKPAFHGGTRNDGTACFFCHTPNGANKGWSYTANTFIHGIHGASKRTTHYTFTEDWNGVGYPGILKNCEQCHLSGTYDYSATASAASVGKTLYNTVATGTTAAADATTSPYIAQTAGTAYGAGLSVVTTTGAVVTTEPAATTLVSSPISAACFSCHDTDTARSHMEINGGSIYAARTSALARKETCLICHGAASSTNVANNTTPAIKAVHRWW